MVVQEPAYAKINLGLKVIRRRSDGYHDLLTVLQTVDLCDTITLCEAPEGVAVRCNDPTVPSGADNLAHRAALAVQQASGGGRGVEVEMDKRVPSGAGLGGGSADAAAVIRGLNRLWGIGWGADRLQGIAAQIGSDVPFLLHPGTAIASGRGEILRRVAWDAAVHYVLVYPNVPISTGWAYGRLAKRDLTDTSEYAKFIGSTDEGPLDARQLFATLENDFEPIAEEVCPAIPRIREGLLSSGACAVSLSGTGSTVYGVFTDAGAAQSAPARMQAAGWRAFAVRPVMS